MKLNSTLLLLFLFSSYHLAESKSSKTAKEDEASYKASINNLGTAIEGVTNAIKSILDKIVDSTTKGSKAAESALKVFTDALLKAGKDNGKTGPGTAAYFKDLAAAVNLAASAAKATADSIVPVGFNYAPNNGIGAIDSILSWVLSGTESEPGLNLQTIKDIQKAILVLKNLIVSLKTAAESALQDIADEPIVDNKPGLESDEAAAALGDALQDLSEGLKEAADLSLKAVQAAENS